MATGEVTVNIIGCQGVFGDGCMTSPKEEVCGYALAGPEHAEGDMKLTLNNKGNLVSVIIPQGDRMDFVKSFLEFLTLDELDHLEDAIAEKVSDLHEAAMCDD